MGQKARAPILDSNATPPSGFSIAIPGYTIISELGKGGMATVYLAIQQNFGRKVALKIMSPALTTDPTFSERFLREARIVAGLSHPNIVQVYDVGEYDNYHYIAMEYHPGGDLQERIAKGISIEDSVRIIGQVALALDYAHSKGYIHRDVKPDNVLFREDGSAVLTDFGIAKPTGRQVKQMTQVGKVVGTPKYMSPEQARGLELDARSDIYALGVMFFEMLTGHVPFDGDDPIAIGIKHIKDPVPEMAGDASAFQAVMEIILAKDVEDRYQHARDFTEALEEVMFGEGGKRGSGRLSATQTGRIGRINTPAAVQKTPGGAKPLLMAALITGGVAIAGAGVAIVFMPQNPLVQKVMHTAPAPGPIAGTAAPAQTPARPKAAALPASPVTTATAPAVAATASTTPAASPAADTTAPAAAPVETATPVAAAQPAPEPVPAADAAVDQHIKRLLQEAAAATDKGQLVRPIGQSAADKYRAVLQIDAQNADAQQGMRSLAASFIGKAREATGKREFLRAKEYMRLARELAGDAEGLDEADKALAKAQEQSKSPASTASSEPKPAAPQKDSDNNQTDLMMVKFRVTGLLRRAEDQRLGDKLTQPVGNNAWDSYQEVLKLDPDNASAKIGQREITDRLAELVSHAVDAHDADTARSWLEQAQRVAPTNPRIRQLAAEVAKLQ